MRKPIIAFLSPALVTFAIAFTTGCASTSSQDAASHAGRGLAIVQGLTNAKSTQISIVAPEKMALTFTYARESHPDIWAPIAPSTMKSKSSNFVVHQLFIEGLDLKETYILRVTNQYGAQVDERRFHALDVNRPNAKIAVGSCAYDLMKAEGRNMWRAMIEAKPDLVLFIGDNVYGDIVGDVYKGPVGESILWQRYVETWQALEYYRTPTLIPTLATWDDHDFGVNDGDRTHPMKTEAKKVITSFYPQAASAQYPEFEAGPGVASRFDAFGYRFLLLDNRSFRSPNSESKAKPDEQTHFGEEQEEWIEKNVRTSKTPLFLASGDQWFGAYHRFESYEGSHPESMAKFLSRLKQQGRSVVFLSGDRHLSEVSKIEKDKLGYETYEFVASPLHSRVFAANWDKIPNKRQIMGADRNMNFTQLELSPPAKNGSFQIKGALIGSIEGAPAKELYRFDLPIKR